MHRYRNILMLIWLVGGGAILLLFIAQTQIGAFDGQEDKAWQWLLPNLLPTLTLVLGVTRLTVAGRERRSGAWPSLFLPSLLTSLLFLAALLLSLLLLPFARKSPSTRCTRPISGSARCKAWSARRWAPSSRVRYPRPRTMADRRLTGG